LPGGTIKIKGTSHSVTTDTAGNFALRIPDNLHQSKIILVAAYIGFAQKELLVTDDGPLTIEMNAQVLGEIEMVVISKEPFMKRMKSQWKKLWEK